MILSWIGGRDLNDWPADQDYGRKDFMRRASTQPPRLMFFRSDQVGCSSRVSVRILPTAASDASVPLHSPLRERRENVGPVGSVMLVTGSS